MPGAPGKRPVGTLARDHKSREVGSFSSQLALRTVDYYVLSELRGASMVVVQCFFPSRGENSPRENPEVEISPRGSHGGEILSSDSVSDEFEKKMQLRNE